jgi:hypothetical protein
LVLSKEKPIPYQPPLPPNEAPSGVDAAAGVTPVGLRPPFVTPAAAHSHPDCRGIPILIVAPQFELFSKPIRSPQKAFRTYQLTFENGEPIFTLSEVDRILEKVFEEIFYPATIK